MINKIIYRLVNNNPLVVPENKISEKNQVNIGYSYFLY